MAVGAGYDLVLSLHVLSALVAFGATLATGAYASLATRCQPEDPPEAVLRYFRPGTNWASRAIWLVPVLGAALVGMSRGEIGFGQAWLASGTALWVVAAGVAHAVVWPAEREVQGMLAARKPEKELAAASLGGALRRVQVGVAAVDLVLLASFVLMFAKPGGSS